MVLNTGRSIQEALWFARQAGICGLVAALGGAAVADSSSGEVLLRRDMEEPWGRRALALCLGRDIELMIFAGSQILLDPFSRRSLQRSYPFPVFHQASVTVEDPLAYLEEQQLPMTKIHGDGNPETYPLAELERLPGVTLTASSDRDFEVVPAGTGQGDGPGLDGPVVRYPAGGLRRRGGQRQRPGHAPGGRTPHRHGQRGPGGPGSRPGHRTAQQPGGGRLGNRVLSGGVSRLKKRRVT